METVLEVGRVRGSGLQFFPLQLASTRIGPVSSEGGLLHDERNRLSVIVGTGISLRHLADAVLALWNNAAPFTPAASQAAPAATPPLTRDVLARGLLVYNRYYLGVVAQPTPSMTGFAGGLRFPLPVEIDQTGVGVVNRDLIQRWAGSLEAACESLLDKAAAAVPVPTPARVQQDASAFLAANPDALSRGVALGARAIKNPIEAQPLVAEVFRQVGADGEFELAIAVMDNLLNSQVGLLASQTLL